MESLAESRSTNVIVKVKCCGSPSGCIRQRVPRPCNRSPKLWQAVDHDTKPQVPEVAAVSRLRATVGHEGQRVPGRKLCGG